MVQAVAALKVVTIGPNESPNGSEVGKGGDGDAAVLESTDSSEGGKVGSGPEGGTGGGSSEGVAGGDASEGGTGGNTGTSGTPDGAQHTKND